MGGWDSVGVMLARKVGVLPVSSAWEVWVLDVQSTR